MAERTTSEKILALKEMLKMSGKYCSHLNEAIQHEIDLEYERLRTENRRRSRIEMIGK